MLTLAGRLSRPFFFQTSAPWIINWTTSDSSEPHGESLETVASLFSRRRGSATRVPDAAIQLDALTVFRADRNAALCCKTRGGGVCVYINTEWCKNSVLVSSYCSSLVEKTLCRVNPRKSAGPDNIPGRVLRECAEQLADVLTDIFNISLSSNVVPTCLKTT
ncbi:hypothetical protein HF521_011753, partial [Silurus meridionalis]